MVNMPNFDSIFKIIAAVALKISESEKVNAFVEGLAGVAWVFLVQPESALFPVWRQHFEQAPRVFRPPPVIGFATLGSPPATQRQRSKDQSN